MTLHLSTRKRGTVLNSTIPGTVTSYARHKFGKDARPVIKECYDVSGWSPSANSTRLTKETAEQLLGMGITMVRVNWRFRKHEVLLRRYLGV